MSATTDVCINIGPNQRRQRMLGGMLALVAAALLSAALTRAGAPRVWRLALFIPLLAGWVGVLQARSGTCVGLAMRGQRHLDQALELLDDPAVRAQINRQARGIMLRAVLIATGLTLAAWLVPLPR